MKDRIAVSIFVSEDDHGVVSTRSLAADDAISQAINRMSVEQIENLLKYMRAAIVAQEAVSKGKDGGK